MTLDETIKLLEAADAAYYNSGRSTLTDEEYDKLKATIKKNNVNADYLKRVGAPPPVHLTTYKHSIPMNSCQHATTPEEFFLWWNKYGQPELCATHKVDGSSIGIYYDASGKLERVLTRGSGVEGSDITLNARQWKQTPTSVSIMGKSSVRGEAILLTADFKKYFPDEKLARSIGNGILMRKTDKEDENKHLSFMAFDFHHESRLFINQSDKFDFIKTLGFNVVPYKILKTKEDIDKYWSELNATRDSLPYAIDGAVMYIQNITKQMSYGVTDGRPKGTIAWKPTAKRATTRVIGITITTGKTGAHVPCADLEPVVIDGSTIKSALLTTFDEIERLGLNIGDTVELCKAGDIIPKILQVVKKNSIGNYPMPTACIACESSLVKLDAYLVCPNHDHCPGQSIGRIDGWISKNNIKHLGDELLQTLFDGGVVTEIVDLYKIDWKLAAKVKRGNGVLGDKMAARIAAEVDKTRTLSIDNFLGSMGLKFIGRRTVEIAGLKTIEEWLSLTAEEAAKLEGIGPTKAEGIVEAIQHHKEEILELLEYVKIEGNVEVPKMATTTKASFSFCLTGKMSKGRAEISTDLEALGHTTKDDVVSGLTYLVCADTSSTSSKMKKAAKLGVKVISEEEMWKLVK